MEYRIEPLTMDDYAAVYALWQASEGVGLSGADSPENIARFLERNPGLAFVARAGKQVVGAVMVGDDGRRGYLYHLAVSSDVRRQGVGRALVDACMTALRQRGISKCHIFVFGKNETGQQFWEDVDFYRRDDLVIMSREV